MSVANPLLSEAAQRNLVLASRSPRRVDILRGLDIAFDVVPAAGHIEERATNADPFERAIEAARLKAADVAQHRRDALVIGADTMVILGERVLEKPANDDEARGFLRLLSGETHTVVTGVAVVRMSDGIDLAREERTRVHFRKLSDDDIARYVASGDGRDKAGSYAVQGLGAGLVSAIEGCFYNVVGLPVSLLFDLLEETVKA